LVACIVARVCSSRSPIRTAGRTHTSRADSKKCSERPTRSFTRAISYGPIEGVSGNNDTPVVCDRVSTDRIVEWEGLRIAVVHGHEHTDTALSMFARQSNADLVIVGHSHAPEFRPGIVPVLNPGSHADPRWNRPAYAELEWDDEEGVAHGRLVEPSGTVFERFVVEPRGV
jgi:hypothetical protein